MVNSLKFLPTKRRIIFNICCKASVMGSFIGIMISIAKIFFFNTQINVPSHSLFFQKPENLFCLFVIRSHKIFQFHLFKFPTSESKIPGSNLVSESFSDLCNTERKFNPRRVNNILKINKNSLGNFSSKISFLFWFSYAQKYLCH